MMALLTGLPTACQPPADRNQPVCLTHPFLCRVGSRHRLGSRDGYQSAVSEKNRALEKEDHVDDKQHRPQAPQQRQPIADMLPAIELSIATYRRGDNELTVVKRRAVPASRTRASFRLTRQLAGDFNTTPKCLAILHLHAGSVSRPVRLTEKVANLGVRTVRLENRNLRNFWFPRSIVW